MDELRLFFLFQITNRDIGFLLDNMLNGFSLMIGVSWSCDLFLLHFLILGNLVAEVGGLLKIFLSCSLRFKIFSLNQALINYFRINKIQGQVHLRTSFIQEVNGLVRQEAILYVAIGQSCSCFNCSIGILNVVVVFVFF